MRLFAQKFFTRLRGRASDSGRLPRMQQPKQKLELEALEDRCLLSTATSSVLSGVAFIDVSRTGALTAKDLPAPGVVIDLNGTTTQAHSSA